MEEPSVPTNRTFKHYLFFWSGQLFSLLGSSIVSFVIIWFITIYSESAIYLSIAYFFSIIPLIVLSPITGVIADRFNRKTVIVIVDSLQALTTLSMIIIFFIGMEGIWIVILLNGLRSVFQAFHSPASTAIIPTMVPKEHLSRINGINYLLTSFIQVIGPLIAAPLLIFFDINQILWVDVVTFLIALIPLILIKIPHVISKEEEEEELSFFQSFSEGLKIVRKTTGILPLLIFAAIINFFIMPYMTLNSLFVYETHSGGEIYYSIISAAFQGGLFIGAIFATVKKSWQRKGLTILIGVINESIGLIIIALAPIGNFFIIAVGSIIFGFSFPIVNTLIMTIFQTRIAPDKQGRVMSISIALSSTITPISVLISGPLAEFLGIIPLFLYSAIAGIIVTLAFWIFTDMSNLDEKENKANENEG
jgi:DHA3 family macrolide efflux protein-like MFS transporter